MTCRCGASAATVVPEPLCRRCAERFYRAAVRGASRTAGDAAFERSLLFDVAMAEATTSRIWTEWHAARRRHEFAIVRPFVDGCPTLDDLRQQMLHVNKLKALKRGHPARHQYREIA